MQWNGAPLTTTFVSASQLTAAVPAALIAAAGTASVTVTGDGGTSNALAFTITAQVVPATTSAGIVNDASFLPAIAPGALIAIFGSNLAAATAQFSTTPLPTSLGNTSVSINGTNVPLLYVSPTQVNAQVPYETKVGTAQLIVQSNGVPSPAVNFQVAATGPGVFTTQQNNHVLALNLADGSLNASQTPAQPGQYVTAYLTGQGLVNPAVTTGDVAPASPFSLPVAAVQVKIGGVVANVQFAGLAPGFVDGLLQMNIQIPDVPAGELPFDVSVGGVAAATTTISIAAKQASRSVHERRLSARRSAVIDWNWCDQLSPSRLVPLLAAQQIPTIRVPVRLVTLPALVFSRESRLLPGLQLADFRVLDNGRPQAVTLDTSFRPGVRRRRRPGESGRTPVRSFHRQNGQYAGCPPRGRIRRSRRPDLRQRSHRRQTVRRTRRPVRPPNHFASRQAGANARCRHARRDSPLRNARLRAPVSCSSSASQWIAAASLPSRPLRGQRGERQRRRLRPDSPRTRQSLRVRHVLTAGPFFQGRTGAVSRQVSMPPC